MKKFVIRRLALSVVILFFVSFIIYSIERCLPSSFVETKARTMSEKPGAKSYDELVEELNAAYGLDKSIVPGYFHWAGQAIRGEFGDSWEWNKPVTEKFKEVIWD